MFWDLLEYSKTTTVDGRLSFYRCGNDSSHFSCFMVSRFFFGGGGGGGRGSFIGSLVDDVRVTSGVFSMEGPRARSLLG